MTDLRENAYFEDDLEPAPVPARVHRIRYNPTDKRSDAAFRAAARNSRRVRWLKFALPGAAIFGVIVFLGSARFIPSDLSSLVKASGIDVASNSILMDKPHISGFEGTRRAYEVKATSAVQNLDDPKVMTFSGIDGQFGLDDASVATVEATTGVYDGNDRMLTLKNGITIEMTSGTTATLEAALIDLAKGDLSSTEPVEIRTDQGTIRANSVVVTERGKRVVFSKGVSVVYLPPGELVTQSGRASAAAAVEAE